MKRLLLIFSLTALGWLAGGTAFGQNARLKAANRQFDNYSFVNAIRLYEDLLRSNVGATDKKEALTRLGMAYRKMQDSRNAERVYGQLIDEFPDVESESYLHYAQSLAENGKHRESQRIYSKYGEMQAADMRGRKFTVAYMDVAKFYEDSSSYRISEVPINTGQADFSPMYYQKGLVFVSARNESRAIRRVFNWNQTPFLDLYFAGDTATLSQGLGRQASTSRQLGGAALGASDAVNSAMYEETTPAVAPKNAEKPEVFSKAMNSKYHEGPVTFNKPQDFAVFTRNNYNKGKYGKSTDGINKLKLYSAVKKGKDWAEIKELPFNSNDYSTGHPAFSPDDSKLYFVSDMPGGYGGTDVYVVEFSNGQWGTPINMGKEINTEGNEMFPFVDARGHLYFASDGHEGLGGLDIFLAELKDGVAFSGVKNLGYPINSEKDDFGLITNTDRTTGFFSSNRKRGVADDNIYAFRRTCKQLEVLVYDNATKQPMPDAEIRVVVNGENRELLQTTQTGGTVLCLESGQEYEFKAIKAEYATNSVRYSTRTNSSNHQTKIIVYLDKANSVLVRGVAKSEYSDKPISGAEVSLENEKTGERRTVVTGSDGAYEFEAKPGSSYSVVTKKDKYATNRRSVGKVKKRQSDRVIEDEAGLYGLGEVFEIQNIYYDFGKFFIRPDAAPILDNLAETMRQNPNMQIEVRSHTDSRSSDNYNLRLSENRARAVVDYLRAKGISTSRMIASGYGERQLVNDCGDTNVNCTEDDHQRNRRTEFKVIGVDGASVSQPQQLSRYNNR